MSTLKVLRGAKTRLDSLSKKEGQMLITEDSKEFYVDINDSERIKIGYSTDEIDVMLTNENDSSQQGRDFSENPINLQTEVTGVLPTSNIDTSSLDAHKSDISIHITEAKKLDWDNKLSKTEQAADSAKLGNKSPSEYATSAQGIKADNALPSISYTASDILSKIKTVDGAESGLDADTVDGLQASSFLQTSSLLDATKLTGTIPVASIPSDVPTVKINNVTTNSLNITYSTTDLVAGTSALSSGSIYFVYE